MAAGRLGPPSQQRVDTGRRFGVAAMGEASLQVVGGDAALGGMYPGRGRLAQGHRATRDNLTKPFSFTYRWQVL
jgi:hypothetical protein